MRKSILFIIIGVLLLQGCANVSPITRKDNPITRRKDYVQKHPELKENIRQAILEGKVRLGMTKEQVIASWGEPYNKSTFGSVWGTTEQWTYGTCLYGCTILDFDNQGKLTNYYQSQ